MGIANVLTAITGLMGNVLSVLQVHSTIVQALNVSPFVH